MKATLRELGYPTKNALKAWCRESDETGDIQAEYVRRKPKYSEEQKKAAVEHYVSHGRSIAFTLKTLGYPCRAKLTEWVEERYPGTRKCGVRNMAKAAASLASKRAAVFELCTREGSAQDVASKLDVSRVTLYNWKHQLLGREAPATMQRDKRSPSEQDRDDLARQVEALRRDLRICSWNMIF